MKRRWGLVGLVSIGFVSLGLAISAPASAVTEFGQQSTKPGPLMGTYDVQVISGDQHYSFSIPGECGETIGWVRFKYKPSKPLNLAPLVPGTMSTGGGPWPWFKNLGLAGQVWVQGTAMAQFGTWEQQDGGCIPVRCDGSAVFGPRGPSAQVALMFTTQHPNTKDAFGLTGRFNPLQTMLFSDIAGDCNAGEPGTMVQSSLFLPPTPDFDLATWTPTAYYLSKSAKSCWPEMWCAKLPKAKLTSLRRGQSIVATLPRVTVQSQGADGSDIVQIFAWKVRITRRT